MGSGKRQTRFNGQEDPLYPDGSGLYTSFGGRVGFYTLIREHFIVGVDVGFQAFSNDDSVKASGVTVDSTTKGSGFAANVGGGYRF